MADNKMEQLKRLANSGGSSNAPADNRMASLKEIANSSSTSKANTMRDFGVERARYTTPTTRPIQNTVTKAPTPYHNDNGELDYERVISAYNVAKAKNNRTMMNQLGGLYNEAKATKVKNNADYAEKSQYAGNRLEGMNQIQKWANGANAYDAIYRYINGDESVKGTLPEEDRNVYGSMTDEEKGIFNYLYNTGGDYKDYANSIKDELNYRGAYKKFTEAYEGNYNKETLSSLLRGFKSSGEGLENAFSALYDKSVGNNNTPAVSYNEYLQSLTSQDLKQNAPIRSVASDVLQSTGNMAGAYALGLGNPTAFVTLLGTSAGGQAYAEAKRDGYSNADAIAYGTITGASEALLERLLGGIEGVGKNVVGKAVGRLIPQSVKDSIESVAVTGTKKAVLEAVKRYGADAFGEFTEEYLQEVLDPVYRNVMFGENNEVNPFSADAIYAGVLGALTSGLINTPAIATNAYNIKKTYDAYKNVSNDVESKKELMDISEAFIPKDSKEYKILQERTPENITNKEIEALMFSANEATNGAATRYLSANRSEMLEKAYSGISKDAKSEIQKIAKESGNEVLTATQLGMMYQAGQTSSDYAKAVNSIGGYGVLTSEQAERAYILGSKNKVSTEQQVAFNDALKKLNKGGRVSTLTAEEAQILSAEENADFGVVNFDNLSKKQRASVKYLNVLADSLGLNIKLYSTDQSEKNPNGMYKPETGTVYLDINAGMHNEQAILRAAGHELTHLIRDYGGEDWTNYKSFIRGFYGEDAFKALVKDELNLAERKGRPISEAVAEEEVIANASEMMLRDSKVIDKIVAENRTLGEKIKAFIDNFVEKLHSFIEQLQRAGFSGVEANHVASEILGMSVDTFEKAQEMWDNALITASENRATGKKTDAILAELGKSVVEGDADATERFTGEIATESEVANASGNETLNSLRNDAKLMEASETKNIKLGNVSYQNMAKAKAVRNRIKALFETDRIKQFLPEDVEGNVVEGNSAYGKTVENSMVCIRSIVSNYYIDEVSKALGRPLTVEEQIAVSQVLSNYTGEDIECIYCYVRADRMAYREYLGTYYKQYSDLFDKVLANRDAYKKSIGMGNKESNKLYYDFLEGRANTDPMWKRYVKFVEDGLRGEKSLSESDLTTPEIRQDAIKAGGTKGWLVNDSEAYAQGASWQKSMNHKPVSIDGKKVKRSYLAYNGNILKFSKKLIDNLNASFGLRMYSFSDYTPAYLLENMQEVTDAAVMGLKMLAYTKDVGFAKVFAPTGMGINVSVFGVMDENGNVSEDAMQGAKWADAKAIRNEYDNVGTVFVATNDKLVEWAMDQDWIDVVIPYHTVRTGTKIAEYFGFKDYKGEQEDKKTKAHTSDMLKNIPPTVHMNDQATYESALAQNGLTARFEKWKNHPNYMKLVNETRMPYNKLQPVQPIFDLNESLNQVERIAKEGTYGIKGMLSQEQQNDYLKDHVSEGVEAVRRISNADGTMYSTRTAFTEGIDSWDKDGRPNGDSFVLGTTGDVLQGLGAIESDIYMNGDKINKIFADHPEIGIDEIKKIPQILNNPVLVLESQNKNRSAKNNTRLVIFGTVKAKNKQPVLVALDLRPNENHLIVDSFQKVVSSYSKTTNPIEFLAQSNVLYLNEKKVTSLLRTIGFQSPIELNDSGFIGSISYDKQNVKFSGKPFTDVVPRYDKSGNARYQERGASQEDISRLKEHFGTTNNFNVAGYMLKDGTMLDFSGKHWGDMNSTTRTVDHRDVWEVWEDDNTTNNDEVVSMISSGNIRMMPETNGFNLSTIPTPEQEKMLTRYIDRAKGEIYVDVDSKDGKTIETLMFDKGTKPEVVFNSIKAVLNNGYRSELSQFLYQERTETSTRSLLANALESTTQNEAEKSFLSDYKSKIAALDAKSKELYEVNKKIHDYTFTTNRPADYKAQLVDLKAKAKGLSEAINTMDKKLLKLESTKALKDVVDRERKKANREAYKKYKTRFEEESRAAKREAYEKYKELSKNRAEGREKTAIRHKINDMVKDLNKRMLNPNKKKYIPEKLVRSVIDFLEIIQDNASNYDERIATVAAELEVEKNPDRIADLQRRLDNLTTYKQNSEYKLLKIKEAYQALKDDKQYYNSYDETIAKLVEDLTKTIGNKNLYTMSVDELQHTYDVISALKKVVVDGTKVLNNSVRGENIFGKNFQGEEFTTEDIKRMAIHELRNAKQNKSRFDLLLSKSGVGETYINATLRPLDFFNRISGYQKNGVLPKIYQMLENGQTDMLTYMKDANAIFDDVLTGKENQNIISDLVNAKNLVDVGLRDTMGNSVEITRDMMLALYMHLENEDNTRHIVNGGLTVPEMKKYYGGDIAGSFGENQRRVRFIDEADVEDVKNNIENELTAWEKDFISRAHQYYDNFSKNELNRVTMELYGYKKANVDKYFPIHSDSDYLHKENNEQIVRDASLDNVGFLKQRVKGTNPIYLEGITNTIKRSIDQSAQFVGMAIPMRNYNKMTGAVAGDLGLDSVMATLRETWGNNAVTYLKDLKADILGVSNERKGLTSKPLSEMRGNLAGANLTLNPRVIIGQASSFPMAIATLDTKSVGKAFLKGGKGDKILSAADRELIAKYSPLLWYRNQGNSTQELGDINNSNTLFGKFKNEMYSHKATEFIGQGLDLIQKMDSATVGRLWYAAQYYVDDHFNLQKGTDAYYEKVAEYFNRVVYDTQPNYTTLQRPSALRTKSELEKFLFMYKTQSMQNFNTLYDATARYFAYKSNKMGGITEADIKSAQNNMARAWGAVLSSQLVYVTMHVAAASLILGGWKKYRDDDDEVTWKSFGKGFGQDYLDSLTGMVLGSDWVIDIFNAFAGQKYNTIDVSAFSEISTLMNKISALSKAIANTENPTTEDLQKLLNVTTEALKFFGFPTGNAEKLVKGIAGDIKALTEGTPITDVGVDRSNKQNVHLFYKAFKSGDTAKMNRIMLEFTNTTTAKSQFTSFFKDLLASGEDEANIRKAMKATGLYGDADKIIKTVNDWKSK